MKKDCHSGPQVTTDMTRADNLQTPAVHPTSCGSIILRPNRNIYRRCVARGWLLVWAAASSEIKRDSIHSGSAYRGESLCWDTLISRSNDEEQVLLYPTHAGN